MINSQEARSYSPGEPCDELPIGYQLSCIITTGSVSENYFVCILSSNLSLCENS